MTVTLPAELEQRVGTEAERVGVSREELVTRAVIWYLEMDPELSQELADWQRAGLLTWQMVEDSLK